MNRYHYYEVDVDSRVETYKFFESDGNFDSVGSLGGVEMKVWSVCHFDIVQGSRS